MFCGKGLDQLLVQKFTKRNCNRDKTGVRNSAGCTCALGSSRYNPNAIEQIHTVSCFTQTQVPACLTLSRPSAFPINQGSPMQLLLIDALIQWLSTVPMSSGVHPRQTPGITHWCLTSKDRIKQWTCGTQWRMTLMHHTTKQWLYTILRELYF